jgi:hypothetical protein
MSAFAFGYLSAQNRRVEARLPGRAESGLAGGPVFSDLDALDVGQRWTLAAPGHHLLDRFGLALELGLDAAVRGVANPACDAERAGTFDAGSAEEHPLDPAADRDVDASHSLIVAVGR